MNCINYNEIDFNKLKRLNVKSYECEIYLDELERKIYKLFYTTIASDAYELTLKLKKLAILNMKKFNNHIIVPDSKIVDPSFVGTREDYIEGIDLCDAKDKYSDEQILKILLNVSKNIKEIHGEKIIISDLNFGNIRIDDKGIHHFIDALSYNIKGIPANTISLILSNYLKKHRKKVKGSKNNDKIAFLMLSIQLLLDKYFFDITDYDFEKASETITKLKCLEEIFYDLQSYYVDDVPYLHELIKE